MPATGLFGPHPLNKKDIDAAVRGVGPGTYVLGRSHDSLYYVEWVGRSDTDLNSQLKNWVGSQYAHFKYGFFESATQAFFRECRLFHDFGGTAKLDNRVHPVRPEKTDWKCPFCNNLD
jgi:hypothetical protein